MFLGKKSQKFSFIPLSSYTRVKSWKYVFISTPLPMAITQRRKKENSLCIFFKLLLIPNVSFGTSSSSNVQVTKFRD